MSQKGQKPKPNSKASYAMTPEPKPPDLKTQNRFELLGKIPKPQSFLSNPSFGLEQTFVKVAQQGVQAGPSNEAQSSKQTSLAYLPKPNHFKIRILEAHHFDKDGNILFQKLFPKGKFFLQNNPHKTRKFYEFVLVDSDSVEITHINNKTSSEICYSKCRILKIISETEWGQDVSTHKLFSQNFKPASYDYYDYMDAWIFAFLFRPFDHSWFFQWSDKFETFKFPNWFQLWWLYWGAIPDIFCPTIKQSFDIFKSNARGLVPAHCSNSLAFMARFQIPWIVCWDFGTAQLIPKPFPAHLVQEFKVKWWTNFTPNSSQQPIAVQNWVLTHCPQKLSNPISNSISEALLGHKISPFGLKMGSAPSDARSFRQYLKQLQKEVSETLSRVDSDEDLEDSASSSFKIEELAGYGQPYEPLE